MRQVDGWAQPRSSWPRCRDQASAGRDTAGCAAPPGCRRSEWSPCSQVRGRGAGGGARLCSRPLSRPSPDRAAPRGAVPGAGRPQSRGCGRGRGSLPGRHRGRGAPQGGSRGRGGTSEYAVRVRRVPAPGSGRTLPLGDRGSPISLTPVTLQAEMIPDSVWFADYEKEQRTRAWVVWNAPGGPKTTRWNSLVVILGRAAFRRGMATAGAEPGRDVRRPVRVTGCHSPSPNGLQPAPMGCHPSGAPLCGSPASHRGRCSPELRMPSASPLSPSG